MDSKIRKEIRILKAYALLSTLLFAVLIFVAAKEPGQVTKFDRIQVHRIDIVEPDGTLRLAISDNALSPGPVMGGHIMKTREGKRGAGFIFFNEQGDEDGGMTWGGTDKDGKIRANGGLMFDQFNQDQVVGITYAQEGTARRAGFHVWDRSLTPIGDFAKQVEDVELMKDGPEKTEAMKKIREQAIAQGMGGQERLFVGRMPNDSAVVTLKDTKGRPRLLLSVDDHDVPQLQFLDENGKVTYTIAAQGPEAHH